MQEPFVQEPLVQEPLVQEPLVQESYPQLEPTLAREPLEQAMENPRVRTSAPGEVLVCNHLTLALATSRVPREVLRLYFIQPSRRSLSSVSHRECHRPM